MSPDNSKIVLAETGKSEIGHWELNAGTSELYWSDQVYIIHGLEPGGEIDLDAAINAYHPDDRDKVGECVRRALEEKEDFQFILRIIKSDGETRFVQSTGVVRTDQDGEVTTVFGIFVDITEAQESAKNF